MKHIFISSFIIFPMISGFFGPYYKQPFPEIIEQYFVTCITFGFLSIILYFPWLLLAHKLSKVYEDLGISMFLIIPVLPSYLFWHFGASSFNGTPLFPLFTSFEEIVRTTLPAILSLICYYFLCKFDSRKKRKGT